MMDYQTALAAWNNRTISRDANGDAVYSAELLQAQEVVTFSRTRIAELKKLLSDTDYKDLPNYETKDDEVLADVISQRRAWRTELRNLLSQEK